jgi:hypothetical protein
MADEKEVVEQTNFSIVHTMVVARVAELYMRQLRARPEVEYSEKAVLTSMITRITNWLGNKVTFMSTRYPDMKADLEAKLNIDKDIVQDSAELIDFMLHHPNYSPYFDFIVQSKLHRIRVLEDYEKLREQGLSVEDAEKQLFV